MRKYIVFKHTPDSYEWVLSFRKGSSTRVRMKDLSGTFKFSSITLCELQDVPPSVMKHLKTKTTRGLMRRLRADKNQVVVIGKVMR